MENKKSTPEKIKTVLQAVGAFSTAVSGISLGILALMRVFYPDPKPQQNPTDPNATSSR